MKNQSYWVLLVLSAALLILLSHPQLQGLAWIAWAPLLLILHKQTGFKLILALAVSSGAYLAGFAWPVHLFSWHVYVLSVLICLPVAVVLLYFLSLIIRHTTQPLVFALAPPLFGVAAQWATQRFALGVVFQQMLQNVPLELMQLGQLSGAALLLFLVLFASSVTATWVIFSRRDGLYWLCCFILLTGGSVFYGIQKLKVDYSATTQIALAQHNLPMDGAWRMKNSDKVLETMTLMAKLAQDETIDWLIYPQYALPIDALRNPNALHAIFKTLHLPVLLGTYVPVEEQTSVMSGPRYDMAILYDQEGAVSTTYKAMIPPPLRDNEQVLGEDEHPIDTPWGKTGILLCFEDTQPQLVRQWVQEGAGILIALSNPGHFVGSSLPERHLREDQWRAIETSRFVVRLTANGPSAVIAPNGKIIATTQAGEQKLLKASVGWRNTITPYVKSGNWFGALAFILVIGFALMSRGTGLGVRDTGKT